MHLAAVAAVLTIFAMAEHKAFISAPLGRHSIEAKAQQVLQGSSPVLSYGKPSMQVPRGADNWFLGSAALLCATAAVAVHTLQQRVPVAQPRRCVVACQAMKVCCGTPACACGTATPVCSSPKMPIAVITPLTSTAGKCLLDMPEPTSCKQILEPMNLASIGPVSTAVDAGEKVVAPACRSAANKTHHPARFVAGVRLPASHRAGKRTNPRTAHSARRAVGARLVAKVQCQEVQEPSFDCSRVPVHIQAGLQSRSRVFVQRSREFKTSTTSDGGQAEHVLIETSIDCSNN